MKKLDICLVSLTVAPDSQDGAAKFIRGVFNYLNKQKNCNVTLITAKWNKNLKIPNIIQLKIIKKSFFWIPQFIFKTLKLIRNQHFDIIHGNGPKGCLPLIFLTPKKNFLASLHDLGPFETRFSLNVLEKYLLQLVAKKAKIITTCSNAIRNEIKHYMPEININQIFNLYSAIEDKFKPYPKEAQELKNQLGIKGPILLYIGRIASYKGVDDIIAAYKIAKKVNPNLNLIIAGKPDFYMEKIFDKWKQKFNDIYFPGFIPEHLIPFYYSMADIFITYSYAAEGFGLTPIEAMACGTPVICSSLPAFKEVLQHYAVFVPPKKPSFLAREIINLINDEDKREAMIKNAMHYIRRYSWDSVGKKLEKVYQKVVPLEKPQEF